MLKKLVLLVFLVLPMISACNKSSSTQTLVFWDQTTPSSADPVDYDAFVHHIAFRSVLASLVSQYRVGDSVGFISDSWSVAEDKKTWTFRIRKGVRFENGDEITPDVVVKSLKRIAFILKQRNSQGGFVEHLTGLDLLKNPQSQFPGIQLNSQHEVVISLTKSTPKLLDTISFGLYSIVHPDDYDALTGKWKNPKRVIASGHYRVAEWTEQHLRLELRSDFLPALRHPRPIQAIELVHDPKLRDQADLISRASIETPPVSTGKKMVFAGGPHSGICYIMCRSWALKDSPCFLIDNRRRLRDAFYRTMKQEGATLTLSFFPTIMRGIYENDQNPQDKDVRKIHSRPIQYAVSHREAEVARVYNRAVDVAAKELGLQAQAVEVSIGTLRKEYAMGLPKYEADLYLLYTAILADDPDGDIRFMFLSGEGIRLPDVDGQIKKELSKEVLDPPRINKMIWDQAVIWPLTHFSLGMWVRDDLDLSLLNLVPPPTDFTWIGWAH
ncbi:ABC transporter substrate-binding protein [Bdellovibrionota bacterium FG-1]